MKPKLSVIIPFKDDNYLIDETLRRLTTDVDTSQFEIIIIDDGSFEPLDINIASKYSNVIVIWNKTNRGVGYAFDAGVNKAIGETLVLMGADVRVEERKWLKNALMLSYDHPNAIISTACKGLNEERHMYGDSRVVRHGADLLFRVRKEDLPPESKLRSLPYYGEILQGKWREERECDQTYPIPCLMGACYVTTKSWYHKIGGWGWYSWFTGQISERLTSEESKCRGHRRWGSLEPHISLKTWLAGGMCLLDPNFITGHMFGRKDHVDGIRATKIDIKFFNQLFIAKTLLTVKQADILDEHLSPKGIERLNVNKARDIIKKNIRAIDAERSFFEKIKVKDVDIFEDMFGYDLGWLK